MRLVRRFGATLVVLALLVGSAGVVQGVLAGWVDALGVLPFAMALAALVARTALAAVLGTRRVARRPH